jgi:hypothetical protein
MGIVNQLFYTLSPIGMVIDCKMASARLGAIGGWFRDFFGSRLEVDAAMKHAD